MGRRGPLPKRKTPAGEPIEGAVTVIEPAPAHELEQDVPEPPAGLAEATLRTWRMWWTSAPARWVDRAAHMHRLERWIRDVDMWYRVERDLRSRRGTTTAIPGVVDPARPWLGQGAEKQIRRHPNADLLDQLDARISRVETEYGMTPLAGVRLGLAGVQGALTAEQLNRLIDERSRDPAASSEPAEWAEGYELV